MSPESSETSRVSPESYNDDLSRDHWKARRVWKPAALCALCRLYFLLLSCSALLPPAAAGEQSETAKTQKGQRRRLGDHHQIDYMLAAA